MSALETSTMVICEKCDFFYQPIYYFRTKNLEIINYKKLKTLHIYKWVLLNSSTKNLKNICLNF